MKYDLWGKVEKRSHIRYKIQGKIRQLQVTGPRQITVQVDKTEQQIFFDLQGLTGQRDGKTVTMNLVEIQRLEVVQP